MNLAIFTLSLHVLVAVLGIGLIGALPIAAHSARRAGVALSALAFWVRPLLRTAQLSLLVAFISGAAIDFLAGGAFHEMLWFRLAAPLVIVTAVCLARARATLTRALSGGLSEAVALRRIEYWGIGCVVAVGCIVVLMESKPF